MPTALREAVEALEATLSSDEAAEPPFGDWMLNVASFVFELVPADPDTAIRELTAAKEAIQAGCRDRGPALTSVLPADDDDALAILVLARAIVQKINIPKKTD
jgi:hypothetical protein